jgi:tRNA modification GTPase
MVHPRLLRATDKSGYLSEDTIAAIATPLGGPIAIVRISGPEAITVLKRISGFDPTNESAETRKLYRSKLRDSAGVLIDDALVVFFTAPHSFTGEHCVELHLHGGDFTAIRVMDSLKALGARQALPGEFSFRAVRNGKMNLSQAEATADLILARNEGAATLALEKMNGLQSKFVIGVAEKLRSLAVKGEVGIDFVDQDIEEVGLPALKKKIDSLVSDLEALKATYDRGWKLQEGVRVALVGLPNAGKSSFFNALLGEDRSIVSEFAGTTRDVVHERLTLRGKSTSVTLRLEDTAGLRESSNQVEKVGVERAQRSAREADLVLFVVDVSTVLNSFKQLRAEWGGLGAPAPKTLGILTKCDLLSSSELNSVRERFMALFVSGWVETSALTGAGIREAAEKIADHCEKWIHRSPGEVLLTRQDHVQAVEQSIEHLTRALVAPEIDLFAADVRQALLALAPLIGETVPDDILGRIFSSFCVGK